MKPKTLFLLVGVPVALVISIEIALRLFSPAPMMPELGHHHANDMPGLAKEARWTTDRLGLRGQSEGEGSFILCLGSDNTGHFQQGDADTWWGVMATELAASGHQAHVAATQGALQPASHWAAWLLGPGRDLRPDVVVISVGAAEVLARGPGWRPDPSAVGRPLPDGPGGWKGSLNNASQIAAHWRVSRLKSRIESAAAADPGLIGKRLDNLSATYRQASEISEIPWDGDPGDELIATIKLLAAEAEKRGFTLVVAFEPWPHGLDLAENEPPASRFRTVFSLGTRDGVAVVRPSNSWVHGRMGYLRERAALACDGLGLVFVDGMEPLPEPGSFADDILMTDVGSAAFGKKIAKVLPKSLR